MSTHYMVLQTNTEHYSTLSLYTPFILSTGMIDSILYLKRQSLYKSDNVLKIKGLKQFQFNEFLTIEFVQMG